MKECELSGQCSFFRNIAQQEELTDYFLGLFCEGNFASCARYEAAFATANGTVPDGLFPNEKDFRSLFPATMSRMLS
jgi:hypothetical protein